MKVCKICGNEKDESEFYFQNDKIHLKPYCKTCNKKKAAEQRKNSDYTYRADKVDQRRAKNQEWILKTRKNELYYEKNKDYFKEHSKINRNKYPEKVIAQTAVHKLGKCEKGFHKHHWSYNAEHILDVIILSISRHKIAHGRMIYDQERMMYRKLDGVLLDTKEKHLEYINSLS